MSPSYHPQTNGQVEVSNKEFKNILKKIRPGKDEVHKLPNALYVYQTAYKTPMGCLLFSHLLIELNHRAYLAIKKLTLSLDHQRLL